MMPRTATIALCLLAACGDNLTPLPRTNGGADVPGAADDTGGYASDPDADPYQPPKPPVLDCVPNLDGRIDSSELKAALGVPVTYAVSAPGEERPIDPDGTTTDGGVAWDWSVDYATDRLLTLQASGLDAQWYADAFQGGQFVTPLDAGSRVEAVYRQDDEALWLLGVASAVPEPAEGRTLLVYDAPIAVFRLPISPGDAWTSKGTVTHGELYGLPFAGTDTYEVEVDGPGELSVLGGLSFSQAMRVRTKVTVDPLVGETVTRRQISFMFECFGEVVRATSLPDEPKEDFTTASEVRRLGFDGAPYEPGPAPELECTPDNDGVIESTELQAAIGVPVSYLVSPAGAEREVDLLGETQGDAVQWDWSDEQAADKVVGLEAMPLEGRWYAGSFPKGQFVTLLDAGGAVESVYRRDSAALWLLGVASKQEDPQEGRTLLVYEQPIALFRFPLAVGDEWVSAGNVKNGTLYGLPYAGKDTYEVEVDGEGELLLPDLTFQRVLRVRTRVTVSPAVGKGTSRRQVSYLAECFGEVARATSKPDETEEDFTIATEVRRLGF